MRIVYFSFLLIDRMKPFIRLLETNRFFSECGLGGFLFFTEFNQPGDISCIVSVTSVVS